MSRKVSGVRAGWLAAASVAVAQTGGAAGTPPAVKGKTLSPYYATASTVDWSGGDEAPPELLPPVPSAPVVPAAPAPRAMPASVIQQASVTQPATPPPPAAPAVPSLPATAAPPVAAAPAGPAAPAAKPSIVPAAPGGSCPCGGNAQSGSCPCNAAVAPTCNCNPCNAKGPCGPEGRVWTDAELLLWWTKGMEVPPLVTSSPSGTPRGLAGVVGVPTTRVLFGGNGVDDGMRPGFRVRAGAWLDDCQDCGIEGSFFFLGTKSENRTFGPMDAPVIARPFVDVNPGVTNPLAAGIVPFGSPNSELVVFPGVLTGTINVHTSTDLYGFDANAIKNILCCCNYRLDLLAGYRYLNLQDQVDIDEHLTVLSTDNPAIPAGTTFVVQDRFKSTNEFNGGQIGLAGEYRSGRWYFGGRNLVALGNTHSEVTISGDTVVTTPGGVPAVNAGGLLTQPTNIGTFTADKFAVVYEAQTILGYQVTDGLRAFVSYSYLYWSNVARAGDQIDLVVNSSQIPPGTLNGAARPSFVRNDTNFWAQGISFGLELRY
jgi:hypothetical protein